MLVELNIKNFAIIDELNLRFSPRFNVLTGETGAGKSIIIDAVSTLLGGRAESEYIRAGTDESLVEGIFHLDETIQAAILPLLKEDGLEGEDDEILIELRAAELEVQIKPMLRALEEPEVVMEPKAEREEPLFMITGTGATGVELSRAFRQAIARRAKELFEKADTGENIPEKISAECLATWGISRNTQRASFAARRYAAAVVRSLEGKARMGKPLAVNTYWA